MSGPVLYSDLFDGLGLGSQELLDFTKSVQGLNRNYKAFAKNLDGDAQRINTGLATIREALAGVREALNTTGVGNSQQRKQISDLTAEVGKLAKEQNSYKAALQGQTQVRKVTKQATDELTKSLREQQDALRKAYADRNIEGAQKAALNILSLKRQTDELSKTLRGANSDLTAVSGSYNRLSLDTKRLGEQLRALPGGFDATDSAAQALKKQFYENTQRLKDFDRELNQNFREVGSYAKGIIEAVTALNSQKGALQDNLFALQQQRRATSLTAEQQDKLQAEIRETEDELEKVNKSLETYGVRINRAKPPTLDFQNALSSLIPALAGAYYGIEGLVNGLQEIFERNVAYSDQAADVRKATGQSAEEFEQLAEALKKVDTRTTLAGQLDIAKVGGQLGKTKAEIEGFTKAIDIAVQALEDDFGGGAEQIATELGKIELVFRKTLGPDQNQNLINIGSAINQLGAEGAATAPFLAEVALRVGASAANARLGLKDVLAYATVLQETGSTAEVSGTALNRLFSTLSTRTKESFKIARLADANLTLKQFKNLVNNDFQGALSLFLRGLNTGGTSTTKFNSLLATLKLQSGEAKNAITTLAKNTELLAQKQQTANEQLREGTSLAAEAAIKNDNLAGSWQKLKKDVGDFFTSGTANTALKWLVDSTRAALNFKDGFGALFDGRILGLAKKQVDDYGKALADSALQQRKFADGTDSLLARFTRLSQVQNPTIKQQQELRSTVLALKDRLGETAVVLNKQTGLYDLNTAAVARNTAAARGKYLTDATNLAKRLEQLDKEATASQATATAIQEEATARERLVKANVNIPKGQDFDEVMRYNVRQRERNPERYDSYQGQGAIKPEILKAYTEYVTLTRNAQQAQIRATLAEQGRAKVLEQLKRLGYDAVTAYDLLTKATDDGSTATDNSIDKDKEKKKAIADVAKAEYDLAKQRLEEKLADFQRQQENPANTEEIRLRAAQKAAGVRRELAKLERDELIREAAQTYKDQVNGQRALGVARVRLQESFSAQLLAIDRDLSKEELAIRNALLDKLGEIDQLQLEQEIETLDLIAQDESRSYQERQQAALDAAARRLEIIELEGQAQVRATQGNAAQLEKIQRDLEKKRADVLRQPKPFNADFANEDALKGYERQQLALERRRAQGLVGERGYQKELIRLENEYLDTKLGNLQKDVTKQREAAQLELDIARRKNQQKLDDEREHQRLRSELIQEGLQNVQQLSDSFFEIGANRRQQELQDVTMKKDAELRVAGENEELKAQIEENYRKRELAIRQKQAKADRNQALFNIALNTGMAVTSVLSTGGGTRYADFGISAGILTALVIGQGLAQAAAVLSRPLPQYAKGRTGGPAEWALVGERGPELVSGRSGGAQLFSGPTITYLPQGADVHTAAQTRDILRDNRFVENRLITRRYEDELYQRNRAVERPGRPGPDPATRLAEANRRETDRLISAWHERPEQRLTERGLETFTRRGSHTTRHTTKRYRRNG
ncbi:phage tail tape measure protein [Hymenobacter sp. UYP22]|uniref:phage tail tape measure protein n=1 Tax=Hymenobacter sp. UYP22 TaxID=3156348 RepID=UPI0033940A3F